MQESKDIPIHGYLTLKKIESKFVYCVTFPQKMLPCFQHQGQGENSTVDLEGPQLVAPSSKIRQAPLRCQITRHLWTREGDATLRKVKKEGCSWEEIHIAFPHRSKETLHVHYSTMFKWQ